MLDRSSKSVTPDSDPLSEMLRGLRLDGVDYGRCEMTAPWGSFSLRSLQRASIS
jgi:hypothetical protein